jgi:hypothetical protein
MQMAGSLLAALPTLLVYIFLGRYFLRLLANAQGRLAGVNAQVVATRRWQRWGC